MAGTSIAAELERYGPQAGAAPPMTLPAARRYCRRLARHYENFTVASWLLPGGLRQHFFNIYAYCRWADDLADEIPDPAVSQELLEWWERQVYDCCQGRAVHPVFIALADTIQTFSIPPDPLVDLLVAFRQDQRINRFDTFEEVLDYCRHSANPVGRLVLYLGRCHTPDRAALADMVCTGLQLANFCQDVARDWHRGRIYLPLDHCRRFGYGEADFARHECNHDFRRLLAAEVARAEGFLRRGVPLVGMLPGALRLDVALFIAGGLGILAVIRRRRYDVWTERPALSRLEKLRIAVGCWRQLRRGTFQALAAGTDRGTADERR
jgi:squalene synthase HpnC